MHVNVHPDLQSNPGAVLASDLTGACVHCGFCLETCPTYLDTRDERDSPRGRIYLIKQLLQTGDAGETTRTHLDRCLTCRNCETACPSGMQYGQLLDVGRELAQDMAPRPWPERLQRRLIRALMVRPRLLGAALALGRATRGLLPASLQRRLPRQVPVGTLPNARHDRQMVILEGCVQRAATPQTNAAARRVFDYLGIGLAAAPAAHCCGALDYHLGAQREALDQMRRNIDAWWPMIEQGAEAVVSSASGCGAMIADYGRLLADDPLYADKAARVSALANDIAEALQAQDSDKLPVSAPDYPVAVHTPCTLQHAQQVTGALQRILSDKGFRLAATRDDHLCCGSAGTYSLLQPAMAERLRQRKLTALSESEPGVIVTANVGCQLHLDSHTGVEVKHWVELIDEQTDYSK